MKIKILEKTDKEIKFLLEDSNPQFANALRRIMTVEVPILAIDSVDFSVNESVLYNEVIAHRMGLIPLVFDPKDFHFKDEHEDGKTDSGCEVIFAINKKGPAMVYSKDMKSSNPDVKPLYDNIPIVELFENQKLKLEASASLGLGLKHARYQAAVAFYKYYPIVKVSGKIANPEEIVKACPKNAIKISDNKVSVDPDCDLCTECLNHVKPEGSIELSGDNTKFIFNAETISGLKPEEIILIAIDILKEKVKNLGKEINKL
ncbi:DNA-directed RNA polymerase subunit D [Candidatus Micrarchaeota archaeon RBG_16_36_9]|nr:MAG: DNA-directed RNA polymerase subunit D [Candidatus Micrarchaeota archaeon RBG_16_36_9]